MSYICIVMHVYACQSWYACVVHTTILSKISVLFDLFDLFALCGGLTLHTAVT